MEAVWVFFLITAIMGSLLWTSVLVLFFSSRRIVWTILVCEIQILIAYGVWWFYWGGGIGGEAHLSDT